MLKGLMFLIITITSLSAQDSPLEIGMKAPEWAFKDATGQEFTMNNWEGKVLYITYVDPDESEVNEPLNDALKKAGDDGLLNRTAYKSMGIVDCAATWKPDVLIRKVAGNKAKKFNTTILFDYDAKLRKSWGFKKDTSNIIVLDKNRVVKAISRGKVNQEEFSKIITLINDLQK